MIDIYKEVGTTQKQYAALVKRCIKNKLIYDTTPLEIEIPRQIARTTNKQLVENKKQNSLDKSEMKSIFNEIMESSGL